ncbi:hypothetical protein [Marinobacter nauticus]|uniref:hypothetical protein n=1 Tax=Marinobacter nauticus TaxID=2743 RepID=UPI0011BED960|nr:hypothetical protein [Marinobacter nauticus]
MDVRYRVSVMRRSVVVEVPTPVEMVVAVVVPQALVLRETMARAVRAGAQWLEAGPAATAVPVEAGRRVVCPVGVEVVPPAVF